MGLIKEFYTGFQLFSPIHLFENNAYYLRRINGEIVCGIQANPVHWKIKKLPGLSGKILLKFAPKIPRLKKLINPNNYQFLATEGIFWKKGFESEVSNLLEGILHETNHNSLLLWTDTQNLMLKKLPIKWGFIQKIKADNLISIVAKCNGYSKQEIEAIKNAPKYLSGFDMV